MNFVTYSGFAIESAAFPNVFLRMDAAGVPGNQLPAGGGFVNCQSSPGAWERFQLVHHPDSSAVIESIAFPGAYLRIAGEGVTKFVAAGGGKVNAQGFMGGWERLRLRFGPNLDFTIESVSFPGVFVRMDGSGVGGSGTGNNIVNCQFGAGPYERFLLRMP
ncbi:MAG TPA: hypothetical protein VF574_16915 [Allosphingosinicella sp.]|jgi:phospholipase C